MAHRGASYYAPEETRPSFLLAKEVGADYLELDLQETKDGILVALHDQFLDRISNIKDVYPDCLKTSVKNFTYAQLQKLDFSIYYKNKYPRQYRKSYKGLKILRFTDILDIAEQGDKKVGIYLETKKPEYYPGIEKKIVNILLKRGWLNNNSKVVFSSFDIESLKKFKVLAPQIPRFYLVNAKMAKDYGWDNIIKTAKEICTGLAPNASLGSPWKISQAHKAGLLVHFYTINKTWQMKLLSYFGADGLFTDKCDLALQFYKRLGKIDIEKKIKKIGY